MRPLFFCAALAALGAAAPIAGASPDDDDWRKAFEELQREFREQKAKDEARIAELERRLGERERPTDLQDQIDDLLDRIDAVDERAAAPLAPAPRAGYLDVSLNSLFAAGTSSAPEAIVRALQGGHHDPHKRGFTVQNTEIVLAGAVDPYFRGQANVAIVVDEEGETVVELEEAFAQTTSLPAGLQLKAGQYFTEFGRVNAQHPHQWDFVDLPVVNTRFFGGDGMRGPGARLSWLVPGADFPLEVQLGAQNANGETMVSFLGTGEEEPPHGAFVEREVRAWDDLVTTARVAASWDLSDEVPLQLGVSRAWGPSGASSNGSASVTGVDAVLKWKPTANDRGFPFVAVQAEWMRRRFGFDSYVDGGFEPGGVREESGGYAQVVWGFQRDWTIALRHDRARGARDDVLGLDDRARWSAALTYATSEFAKVRLQVNRDRSKALDDDVTSVWLQLEFSIGAHGAHKF